MSERRIGIVMNGVTGRMGRNQHLLNSIMAIRQDGGLLLDDGTRLMPEPMLVGRDEERVAAVAKAAGVDKWSTDLDAALGDKDYEIYFDGVTTSARAANLKRAIAAGKHIYTEKPISVGYDEAEGIYRDAKRKNIKHGVVADKLWAPGMYKLRQLIKSGFFGDVLMVRIEGCYWVFEGDLQPPQRPSWNSKKAEGGGMILDMMPHYFYMLEATGGRPLDVVCQADTLVKKRWDEKGVPYTADADDSVMALSRLAGGAMAQITSSWCLRVHRPDIIVMQIDGTHGSAVAGLSHCYTQRRENTPKAQWSLDVAAPVDYYAGWQRMPEVEPYKNAFRIQWELFLRHVVEGGEFPWNLLAGARGVQYADAAEKSWKERRWMDLPDMKDV
jgi:predicted dehydrogenase